MTRLIGALQDAARLEAGHALHLDRRPTDVVALARRLAAEHTWNAERHRIRVETNAAELVGDWDPDRLERALDNLLGNAVKFSPDGGDVVVAVARDGREAVLRVRDQGVGIPAADLPRLFERFHRGANVVGRIGGAGIGLADVHRVVAEHGGAVSVESRVPDAGGRGGGSTITVRLPLRAACAP
jgi:signal transduction histidine kinase